MCVISSFAGSNPHGRKLFFRSKFFPVVFLFGCVLPELKRNLLKKKSIRFIPQICLGKIRKIIGLKFGSNHLSKLNK